MSKGFIVFLIILLVLGVGFWLTKDYFFQIREGNVEFAKIQEFQNENFKWESSENFKYKFSLYFPNRWKNMKAEEKDNSVKFSLEHKTSGYGEVFSINVISKEDWLKLKSEPLNYSHIIREKKDGTVFTYVLGQDDEGYIGFPEVVLDRIYRGPYYDVQNFIIGTFDPIISAGEMNVSVDLESCVDDRICPIGFICYDSQYSAPSPESRYKNIEGPQEGDLLCHKSCETDVDCGIRKCLEKRLFNGDTVEIKKFCD